MRINRYVALATGLGRRTADEAVQAGRVAIDGQPAEPGDQVSAGQNVTLDGRPITPPVKTSLVMLHKPPGYVTSREGQGSRTIYDLLPAELHRLKPVGRLDKESSGLLLLTDDGELANRLTHPRYAKEKVYEVSLDKRLAAADRQTLGQGVTVEDYVSRLELAPLDDSGQAWRVRLRQGRNRQIRRSFATLGYDVVALHRRSFGVYHLENLAAGHWLLIARPEST